MKSFKKLATLVVLFAQSAQAGLPPVRIAPVGNSPNSGAATAVGNLVTLQPADLSNPGLVPSLPLPIGSGGFGQSMAAQTVSAVTSNALTPGFVYLTNAAPVLNGITAGSNGQLCFVVPTSGALSVNNQNGSASAANRIITPTGGTVIIPQNGLGVLSYNSASSRWVLAGVTSRVLGVTPPMTLSLAGVLAINQASAFQSGFLSSSDWNTFNNKLGGAGADKALAFFNALSSISGDETKLNFDASTSRMGVGLAPNNVGATVHAKSSTANTISNPTSFSAELTLSPVINTPTSTTVGITTPDIAKPDASTAVPSNLGSGGYSPSDTVDWDIRPGYDDGVNPIVWGRAIYQIAGITDSSNPFDIDYAFAASGAQNFTPNIWSVSRVLNGGSPEYQRFTSATGTDNNTGWVSGSDTFTVFADDFLSDGSNSDTFSEWGKGVSPLATDQYSPTSGTNTYSDPNNGNTFKFLFQGNCTADEVKIVNDTDAVAAVVTTTSGTYSATLSPSSFSAPITTTPRGYGYQSNGSILSKSYSFVSRDTISGNNVYSVGDIPATTTDPNDGNYYYVALSGTTSAAGGKVINFSAAGGKNVAATFSIVDDGVTTFPDGTAVTPTSFYVPGLIGEAPTGYAGTVTKDSSGSSPVHQFLDSTGAELGAISGSSSGLSVSVQLSATNGLRIPSGTPPSSSAACTIGQIKFDSSYLYVCTGTSTWKRAALSSF